jgi:type IV secretory pathway VirB4 component
MKSSNNNKHLRRQSKIEFQLKNLRSRNSRPVTTANYIPRFSESDYAANGWIKSDPDVIPLTQPNIDMETSPKQHDRSWTTASTRIHSTYDKIDF